MRYSLSALTFCCCHFSSVKADGPVLDVSEASFAEDCDAAWQPDFDGNACDSYCFGSDSATNWLSLDVCLSDALLDFQNRQTDKEILLLEDRMVRIPGPPHVIVGGQGRFSLLLAATNSDGKFPYLGRFPTDFTGDTATDARLLHGNMHATAHITPFASAYGELLFSDVFSFGDFKQGSLQVRQAYAVLGDLRVSPMYAYIGKKNVGFGDLSTLSPFTQSVVWHYFAALAEGIGMGYHDDAWDVTLAAINGGRGIRTTDSPERGKLNNMAFNATYHLGESPTRCFQVGAGFLLGTIYDSDTAEHINADQFGDDYNSAWAVNSRFELGSFSFAGEYMTTVDDWPVTDTPVSAWRAESAYWFDRGAYGSFVSVSWSSGEQGPSGSEFEFNNQLVLGYGKRYGNHCRVSAEYVRSLGFAPLINITTVSDRDVAQDSIVLGLNLLL